MTSEMLIALITSSLTVLATIWAQKLLSKSNVQVASIDAYADVTEQLRESLAESRKLNDDLINATRKLATATEELSTAREAIQELTNEVKRLNGDASAGLAFLEKEKKEKQIHED